MLTNIRIIFCSSQSTPSTVAFKRAAICVQLNDGVMFDLGDGAQDYPQYDDASLLNTNAAFDFAQFDKMMVDAKAAQVRTFFSLLTSFFFSSSSLLLAGFLTDSFTHSFLDNIF